MQFSKKVELINSLLPKTYNYMEIGVWKGELVKAIFDSSMNKNACHYTLIDPGKVSYVNKDSWYSQDKITQEDMDEICTNVLTSFIDNTNILIYRGDSLSQYKHISQLKYDLIYIDGDHSLFGVCQDIILSLTCLKNTGFIICDDYRSDKWWQYNIIDAVEYIVQQQNLDIKVIDDQAIIRF